MSISINIRLSKEFVYSDEDATSVLIDMISNNLDISSNLIKAELVKDTFQYAQYQVRISSYKYSKTQLIVNIENIPGLKVVY